MSSLSNITVAILAGGLGSRLRSVNDQKQKVLIEVNGHPFAWYLLDKLNSSGFQNIVICAGYLGAQMQKEFGNKYKNLKLSYSIEKSPLGTAGALRFALPLLNSEEILVLNGDSYCEVNLEEFWKFHVTKNAKVSIVVTHAFDTEQFGKINMDRDNNIISFEEKKQSSKEGWINAGIYLIKKPQISKISEGREVSLENEVFPKLIDKKVYGYETDGDFIDIGTPQSYSKAGEFFKKRRSERFILLDRDGTLVIHRPYLSHPDQIELIPEAVEALKEFKKMGLGIVIITNQAGVGRGYFDLETLGKIHQRLTDLLAKEGVFLDDIYFCPHTPEDDCLCRKPKVKLIEKAAREHNFDPKQSFVIGDNRSDVELGKNIGAITILVKTGYGKEVSKDSSLMPNYIVDSLKQVKDIIARELNKSRDIDS